MSPRTATGRPGSLYAPVERDAVRIGALWVDRTPVTNRRYAAFVAATGHRAPVFWNLGVMPSSLSEHPVVGVDFFDVLAYARWAGGFPPTLGEWLLASGLDEAGAYPWGDRFDNERCNTVRSGWRGTSPVGAHAAGAAPTGCLDLCGNVWEMTCTPAPGDPESVLTKGGSWYDYPVHAKLNAEPFRTRLHRGGATVGFRLVYGSQQVADFLPEEVIDHGIAFRRKRDQNETGEDEAHADWTDTVTELRRAAATKLDLSEVAQEIEIAASSAIERVHEFFERAESEPTTTSRVPPKTTRRSEARDKRMDQVLGAVERLAPRPRLKSPLFLWALVPAVLIALWMVYSLVASTNEDRKRTEAVRSIGTEVEVRTPEPAAPARPSHLERAIQNLDSRSIANRLGAERDLLDQPDESLPLVIAELGGAPGARARSSLLYLYSVMAEGPGRAAQLVDSEPGRGLVLVFSHFDAETRDLALLARRTARAEGVEFTAVYSGRARADAVIETFGLILSGSDIYMDTARPGYADRFAVDWPPELLGLAVDGSVAFRHQGRLRREQLLEELPKLSGSGR